MAEPFLGEIRAFSCNFAPTGWALCNGQLLAISQNQALFALLGTTYGGNGQTNFALPDLRGRVPAHRSDSWTLGLRMGETAHTLTISELPPHTHAVGATDAAGTQPTPSGAVLGAAADVYGAPNDLVALRPDSVTTAGGSQPHTNMQPYQVITYCIALQGVFPSAN